MTLYCDVDGTLLDSSARHEKLLRDLLAARGLFWPAAAPDYLRYKADGHSTKAWLMPASNRGARFLAVKRRKWPAFTHQATTT